MEYNSKNYNDVKYKILTEILTQCKYSHDDYDRLNKIKLIEEIIELCDDNINEGIKTNIMKIALAALPYIMTGCSNEEVKSEISSSASIDYSARKNIPTANMVNYKRLGDEKTDQVIEMLKSKYETIQRDIRNNNSTNSNTQSHMKNLAKLYQASHKIINRFDEFKDNKYLLSVFVTGLFASDRGLYESIGHIEKSRVTQINTNQRNILFYEFVIKEQDFTGKSMRTEPLNEEELKQVRSHPIYDMYAAEISNIRKTAGSSRITLWLTADLAKYLNNSGHKSYWCGAFVGAVYKAAFGDKNGNFSGSDISGENKSIPMSAFASTVKMMAYAKDKEIAVYSDDFMDKHNISEDKRKEAKINFIKEGVIVLYKFDDGTGRNRMVVSHFGIVTEAPDASGTFKAIEGNTSMIGIQGGYTSGDGDATGKPRNVDQVAWVIVPPELFSSQEALSAARFIKRLMASN